MRHVGNAVPPLLARALRDQIARDLLAAGVHESRGVTRPKTTRTMEEPEERSRVMRAVPSKTTSVELTLRKALWGVGVRGYRLHSKDVPGNPDVVFPACRLAVFVDGCFSHGCSECYRVPQTNVEYWSMKVQRNRDRDERVNRECEDAGWTVLRFWEHEVTKRAKRAAQHVKKCLGSRKVNASKRQGARSPSR
jgi:DNA mismatch endonuclease (patch repair protein)